MGQVIAWAGFLGAWLLFAGPVYQAVLELGEERFETDRLRVVTETVPSPPPVSPWWWLLPPVAFFLRRHRADQYQKAVVESLSEDDAEALLAYVNKAMGWLMVGCGGLLIAAKETYELRHAMEWPIWAFWALVVLMLAISIGYTAARDRRSDNARASREAGRESRLAAGPAAGSSAGPAAGFARDAPVATSEAGGEL